MARLSKKKIKGRYYWYAERSIRLPDGKTKTLSKLIGDPAEAKNHATDAYFEGKEQKVLVDYFKLHGAQFRLPDPDALEKTERMRFEYKKILRVLSPAQRKDLFDRFTVNFTYESNALEGNSLTLKDVAIVVHENVAISGKDLREIYETRNSREVVDLILRRKFNVSESSMLKMHSMLVRDMGIDAGYKKLPNYIHGRQVVTTPPENVSKEMKELFVWYGQNKGRMHPIQLAANFHGKFEAIHPFQDGNGRVGRFLVNVILTWAGYPPLIIRKTQRISYFNALEDYDNGRTRTLGAFLFNRLKETHVKFFKVYITYLK